MKGLQTTLFILAFLSLSTQSFRHIYVKWIEPQGSILDQYKEDYEKKMEVTESLKELKSQYAEVEKQYKEKDALLDSSYAGRRALSDLRTEKNRIEARIKHREDRNREIFELWFFWSCGLISVFFGIFVFLKLNQWIGMAGLISGFCEMVFWTKPSFRAFGGVPEFDVLLSSKLILSILTLIFLTTLWFLKSKYERKEG